MNFIAMDFETANYQKHSACSLALVMVQDSKIVGEYYTLIQPETEFFWKNIQIHGIRPEDVKEAPKFPDVWKQIQQYYQLNSLIVAHNAGFDTGVLADVLIIMGCHNQIIFPYARCERAASCIQNLRTTN